MKQLIKNELIKLRAQKTYVVLSCIVLALVIIVSFCTSVLMTPLNNLIEHGKYLLRESAAYDWAADVVENDSDSALAGVLRLVFKNPKTEAESLREQAQENLDKGYTGTYAVYTAQAEFCEFRDQNGLEDWIVSAVQNSLTNAYRWRDVVKGLQDGTYTPDNLTESYELSEVLYFNYTGNWNDVTVGYYYYISYTDYDAQTGRYSYVFIRVDEGTYTETECTWNEVLADLSEKLAVCEQYIDQVEQYALTLEPDLYYDSLIAGQDTKIAEYQENIKVCEEKIKELDELHQDERDYYERQIENLRGQIEDCETVKAAYETLKQQKSSPDSSSFAVVNQLLPELLSSRRSTQSSLESLQDSDDFALLVIAMRSSYNHQLRVLDKAITAVEYAYTHDVLPEDMHASSAKTTFISNLTTASFLVSAVTIVLASMILSREFATGTVRLWVIRPKTRGKLLGSKIAALLIYVCGMMGVSFVITYAFALANHAVDLFFYGQSTLFVSNYGVLFGIVVPIPAVLECLWALVILTLPVILYAMLCLFISVLTKKGVLGIVGGMLVLMFATDIQALALIVANYTGVFGYALQATVLPYLSMDRLLVTSLDFGVSVVSFGSLDGLGAILGLETMLMSQIWGAAPYVCSTLVGAGVLIIHILLLIWASLFAFKRMQIKS